MPSPAPAFRHPLAPFSSTGLSQLRFEYDGPAEAVWCAMNPSPRACFTTTLLEELLHSYEEVQGWVNGGEGGGLRPVRYLVGASDVPGVFNLGGDLDLFIDLIETRDEEGLRAYAHACIELVHLNANNLNLPLTTIAVVEGDALGGGFEAAISCNVVIAERRATFGLPEVLFNLFPGMGAYTLLTRRIGAARAERLILSRQTYQAEEMHEMGVVDILAENGRGREAVRDFIRQHGRRRNAYEAVFEVRRKLAPVTLEELRDVTEIWIRAAFRLQESDLRLMRRLVRAQYRRAQGGDEESSQVVRLAL